MSTAPLPFASAPGRLRYLLRFSEGVLEECDYGSPFCVREVDLHDPLLPPEGDPAFERLERDFDRNAAVRRWVDGDHGGDVAAALRESPLLVSEGAVSSGLCPEGSHLVDGWHRLRLARLRGVSGPVTIVLLHSWWVAH